MRVGLAPLFAVLSWSAAIAAATGRRTNACRWIEDLIRYARQ